jgi:transposase-like protein
MAGGKQTPIKPEVKAAILTRIRAGKESISEVAMEFGVGRSTIHSWLEKEVKSAPSTTLSEIVSLRKENTELYQLIGRITLEMDRAKKRGRGE